MNDCRQPVVEPQVESFAHHLVVALVNLQMHAPDSSHVRETLQWMLDELAVITAARGSLELRLEVAGEHLRCGDHALVQASLQAGRLLRLCHERSIRALVFGRALAADELLRFLQLLVDERAASALDPRHVAAALRQRGIEHARVELDAAAARAPADAAASAAPAPGGEDAIRQYQAMADVLQTNHVAAFRGEGLAVDATAGIVEQAIKQMDLEPSGLLALAMYDNIDNFTVGHAVRVTLLALQVAQAAGATRHDLLRLGTAALLHDIGKSRVPQEILFKVGRLNEEEREVMARHARIGGEILLEQGGVDPTAIGAAFCHHMGPGGRGYPTPTLPFEPSGVSRLVRVCDVFEALTAIRPYKPPLLPVHAYVLMNRMKEGFDQRWLRFFIHCIGLYPIGTHLILDTGEEARVVTDGPSLHHPVVELLTAPDATPLRHDEPVLATVGLPEHGRTRAIRAVLGAGTRIEIPPHILTAAPAGAAADAGCGCAVSELTAHPTTD